MKPDAETSRDSLHGRLARGLLIVFGVGGLGIWALLCAAYVLLMGMATASDPRPSFYQYILMLAPFPTFSSYIWIGWRRLRNARKLVLWGLMAHLPFLLTLPYAAESQVLFLMAASLNIATLIYANYVWSVWRQAASATNQAAAAQKVE